MVHGKPVANVASFAMSHRQWPTVSFFIQNEVNFPAALNGMNG